MALEGDPRVLTVASYAKTGLDKTFNDLRDKRLLTFDQDKLSRVELIAKKQDVEFGRDKDQWQIVKPKPLRADGSQIDELIRKARDAKMDLALSDEDSKKAASAFASGTPVATVKFTDASGTQQLEVRKNKDDYYAKSSVVPGVYKVTADLGAGVDKGLDDFRNKKLFDFGFNDPNKIEMHDAGKVVRCSRRPVKIGSRTARGWTAPVCCHLIDKLRDLAASKFVDSGSFGTPTMDVTVTSSDGKRVEKVLISKQGNDYLAKRENEPALYGLDSKAVDELSKAASDVKAAPRHPRKNSAGFDLKMTGLLTDLYQLTMAAGYFESGKADELATFELFFRHLPRYRNYVLAAGLEQVVEYLQNLSSRANEIRYLKSLPQFRACLAGIFRCSRATAVHRRSFCDARRHADLRGRTVPDGSRAADGSADRRDFPAGHAWGFSP